LTEDCASSVAMSDGASRLFISAIFIAAFGQRGLAGLVEQECRAMAPFRFAEPLLTTPA